MSGERELLEHLAATLPGPEGRETWLGDDAAVVNPPDRRLLLAADILIEDHHFDLSFSSPADVGWKAVAANVSDIAAMGGRPLHLLVSLGLREGFDVDALYGGISAAGQRWGCTVVGGDVSSSPVVVVSVAITGTTDGRRAVLRSGAKAGDAVLVTGPLGGAAAGLRMLREGRESAGAALHRKPRARPEAGIAAATAGATAMIDVSDGLASDLGHILDQSGVGVELHTVPAHPDATADDALHGGDDYELVICAPDPDAVRRAVVEAGASEPSVIGHIVEDASVRTLAGRTFEATGWEHSW